MKAFPLDTKFCHGETLLLMQERWTKLVNSFYNSHTHKLDATKVPDLYDSIKYDVLHNLAFLQKLHPDIRHVYTTIKTVADFVIPQEYGVLRKEKLEMGKKIVQPLLQTIVDNLVRLHTCMHALHATHRMTRRARSLCAAGSTRVFTCVTSTRMLVCWRTLLPACSCISAANLTYTLCAT